MVRERTHAATSAMTVEKTYNRDHQAALNGHETKDVRGGKQGAMTKV
jgi:hypothetical protein